MEKLVDYLLQHPYLYSRKYGDLSDCPSDFYNAAIDVPCEIDKIEGIKPSEKTNELWISITRQSIKKDGLIFVTHHIMRLDKYLNSIDVNPDSFDPDSFAKNNRGAETAWLLNDSKTYTVCAIKFKRSFRPEEDESIIGMICYASGQQLFVTHPMRVSGDIDAYEYGINLMYDEFEYSPVTKEEFDEWVKKSDEFDEQQRLFKPHNRNKTARVFFGDNGENKEKK